MQIENKTRQRGHIKRIYFTVSSPSSLCSIFLKRQISKKKEREKKRNVSAGAGQKRERQGEGRQARCDGHLKK